MRRQNIKFLDYDVNGRNSILFISFFSAWLLSFPFLGQVLYGLYNTYSISIDNLSLITIFALFLGLLLGGYIVKNIERSKGLSLIINWTAILGSMIFFFPYTRLWDIVIVLLSFLGGVYLANWGFYLRQYSDVNNRIKVIAIVLILSNIIMAGINIISVNFSPVLGLVLGIISLVISLIFLMRSKAEFQEENLEDKVDIMDNFQPVIFLYIFITTITITSGLMYAVITPAFSHYKLLTSIFWIIPYIVGIYIIVKSSQKINKAYCLYLAISFIGLSFLLFLALDRSWISYIIVNTLMMSAFGIWDLFWWSILGELLDYSKNPAKLLGFGLSANILGILIGNSLGIKILNISGGINASVLALIIVFIILMILPFLNKHLSSILKEQMFLFEIYNVDLHKDQIYKYPNLTDRENEIVDLLLTGRTYKMIAEELYLSENTIKTHIKNIYSKYDVQSKSELIKNYKKSSSPKKGEGDF